jgi:hypothetical protein
MSELDDIDEAALIDEAHYENEGADFAMAFSDVEKDAESTAIGVPPPTGRESFGGGGTMPDEASRPGRKNDW